MILSWYAYRTVCKSNEIWNSRTDCTKVTLEIARILKEEGYISEFKETKSIKAALLLWI